MKTYMIDFCDMLKLLMYLEFGGSFNNVDNEVYFNEIRREKCSGVKTNAFSWTKMRLRFRATTYIQILMSCNQNPVLRLFSRSLASVSLSDWVFLSCYVYEKAAN